MKIAFNPSTVAALTTPPNNKDITFDLRGRNIFARGVKFCGTDTNTWRDIKINNVSIGSNILDLRNGSNTTLSHKDGVVTINSTWRPVVDSLTSDSATSSLSANQGRVLAGLINGKSDSDHNHDDRYLKLTGGTMLLGEGLKFHSDDNYFGASEDARIISLLDNNNTICDGGLIIDERATLNGKEHVTELLRIRNSEFKWRGANILHSGNYSGILDSRYYTETEVNSLLNAKLNRQNLSYGTWNPRGYNLAADYSYKGGDLSISESGGQIHVSVDGYFWQNEGRYRVLDTSDIGGIRGSVSIQQYLSNTDTNWYPLIWGGSSHNNTSDSTGAVYKSYGKLSWQTSSQTLYATHLRTTYIDLENSRGIVKVASGGTSPYKGIKLPTLGVDGIGMFSRFSNAIDEGGIIISEDTSVIYNSFDTGWGLTVRDKDRGQTDISGDGTIAFGVRQDYRAYSLGGFEKSGSDNTYVLLGGGGHKLESALNVANADKLDGQHYNSFAPFNGVKFGHGPDANTWHRILQFTTSWVGQVTFMYSPEECQRSYWGIFNINIKSKDIWFRGFSFADVPQIKCIGDDSNNWSVWIKGNTNQYDPYGVIQVLNYSNASIVSVGLDKSQTTEPSGTYNKAPDLFQAGSVNWSDITNKIVAGNEFNVVNAGYNNVFWFNYLPINDRNNRATISTYCMGNGQQGYASVTASGFIKNGGNENQLLRADGGIAAFNWAGQSGQPTWLWGGNDFNSYYVYNPSNFRVAYASSAGNADTLDGEHASSFVRAGHYESQDLNKLDTYSFIRSVSSNNKDTSPKGNIGWYNVIQAVHRNGAYDGPSYIGQIALGMTTNLGAMFYRTKYKGSWYAWNEVVTTNTGLLRYSRNNVNISSPNCSPIPPSLLEWTIGYPRLYDPEFNEGNNNVYVYNNAYNGVVTVTRVHDTNVGNSSNYIMKVVSAAGAIPNYGGWNVATQTELGKVYTCLFRARIPSGVEIKWNSNSIGTGGQMSWLTNNMGTDKWTWYAVQVYCGSGGSTTFFFSAKSPCTWYLSYVNVIENNRASYAGLRSVYSDYLKENASIVFGRNELQYFNQYTSVTAGATNNANPKTDWYHILRMNHADNSGYFVDLAIPFFDNRIQFRRITNGSDNGWRRVITEEPNHNVLLCDGSGGGSVGIGISSPAQKLDVNGGVKSSGFHHSSVNSDNYMLLAGGGYKSFGGDNSNPIFLGYLNLDHGNDGTISSSFSCLGYSVPFTYTRGGNYCRIYIPDTTHQIFYIKAATASVNYSGGGMDRWTGVNRGSGAWWLHCYACGSNEIRVKGFCQNNHNNDSWWGGNPLWSGDDGANKITVCIFGYVNFR